MQKLISKLTSKRTLADVEISRVTYALWVSLGMLLFYIAIFAIHSFASMGIAHYTADVLGTIGMTLSILMLRKGKLNRALNTVVATTLTTVVFYGIIIDYTREASVHFLRLYVTLFSLEGILLLMVSFHINAMSYKYYAAIFTFLLSCHFFVIIDFYGKSNITLEMTSYFVIAIIAINLSCFIASIITKYNLDVVARMASDKNIIDTQNKNLEAKIKTRTAELEESNKKLHQFAHTVSHDLKEPIRTIINFIGLLEREIKKSELNDVQIHEYLKFIKTSGLHASELVKGILNYATTSIDKKQFTSIDLKSILDMVTFQLKNIIQEKNAIISYKALPEIKGDKLLIYQLFQNLISNAINYCYDGRPPEIMITSDTHTDNIVLMVKDNGKGIPHDNITLNIQTTCQT
jgi:signal transduction histidine kinase